MTEIDYVALGKTMAAFVGEMNRTLNERWTTQVTRPELAAAVDLGHAEVVRHLIAALHEQGFVVIHEGTIHSFCAGAGLPDLYAKTLLYMAATGDGETP